MLTKCKYQLRISLLRKIQVFLWWANGYMRSEVYLHQDGQRETDSSDKLQRDNLQDSIWNRYDGSYPIKNQACPPTAAAASRLCCILLNVEIGGLESSG